MFKIEKFLKKREGKIGLPPGSPVYAGEQREESVRIQVIDYTEEHVQEKEISRAEECCELKETPSFLSLN